MESNTIRHCYIKLSKCRELLKQPTSIPIYCLITLQVEDEVGEIAMVLIQNKIDLSDEAVVTK